MMDKRMENANNNNVKNSTGEKIGLSHHQALEQLYTEIQHELKEFNQYKSFKRRLFAFWESIPFHYSHSNSTLHWHDLILMIASATLLIVCYYYEKSLQGVLLIEAIGILILCFLSTLVSWWDNKLAGNDMYQKALELLDFIEDALMSLDQRRWSADMFPSLHSPYTPSISLHWTFRDGELVNLPTYLLVKGDVVLIRPGQVATAKIKQLQTFQKDLASVDLSPGQMYNPLKGTTGVPEVTESPRLHCPCEPLLCIVQETPFIATLRQCLDSSPKRPPSIIDHRRNLVETVLEKRLLPAVLLSSFLINGLRFIFYMEQVGLSMEMYVLLQVYVILPMLPLVFPVLWLLHNSFSTAKFLALSQLLIEKNCENMANSANCDFVHADSSDDLAFSFPSNLSGCKLQIWHHFVAIIAGMSTSLPRTANLLHGLGSTTIFSCIDKKGVLSWPVPKVERVFFLRPVESHDPEDAVDSVSQDSFQSGEMMYVPEIIDLYLVGRDYKISFLENDCRWQTYLGSLKPLGLNILLNTCNFNVQGAYTKFGDHLLCTSALEDHSIAVVNRSLCACELAETIGFSKSATDNYQVQHYIQGFRESQPYHFSDTVKVRRIKAVLRKKAPYPFLTSVVVKDVNSGLQQLFTQGTADMLMDSCPDFWDGKDIHPLNDELRKKIHDFYTRSCLSAYCTAFAYRPISTKFSSHLENFYVEYPSGPYRYMQQHEFDESISDSLLPSNEIVNDARGLALAQSGQIFLGMVVMQYPAIPHVQDMIEKFQNTCVRFVHFSYENELRSRVFAEKLGLETGWNCHVSLYSPPDFTTKLPSSQAVSLASLRTVAQAIITANEKLKSTATSRENVSCNLSPSSRKSSIPEKLDQHLNDAPQTPKIKTASAITSCNFDVVSNSTHYNHFPVHNRRANSSITSGFSSDLSEDYGLSDQYEFDRCTRADKGVQTFTLLGQLTDSDVSPLRHPNRPLSDIKESQELDEMFGRLERLEQMKRLSQLSNEEIPTTLHRIISQESIINEGDEASNQTTPSRSINIPSFQSPIYDKKEEIREETMSNHKSLIGEPIEKDYTFDSRRFGSLRRLGTAEPPPCDQLQPLIVDPPSIDMSQVGECDSEISATSDLVFDDLYDLSNRAKLPRGIENIRPHLEHVDNVPLLVPLFTDCTPDATREMMQIMQDNNEVVACYGSSLNVSNTDIFLQANISLSVFPMIPPPCFQQQSNFNAFLPHIPRTLSPLGLAAVLGSLPCSLTLYSLPGCMLVQLFKLAYCIDENLKVAMTFLLSCHLSLVFLQLICDIFFLPPPLSGSLLLWLVGLILPLLSSAFLSNPLNIAGVENMRTTIKRSQTFSRRQFADFVLSYCLRFLPSILIVCITHLLNLHSFCQVKTTGSKCHMLHGNKNSTQPWNGYHGAFSAGLNVSQNSAACLLVLNFVAISASFVHQREFIWQKMPLSNFGWCFAAPLVIILQFLYMMVDIQSYLSSKFNPLTVSPFSWILGILWAVVALVISEMVKVLEIRRAVRVHRRTKLQFGTKLGMNSPF